MTPDEVKRIGDEQIFVFPPSDKRIFLTRQLDHRRIPELARRLAMKPPEVADLPSIPHSEADVGRYSIEPVSSWRSDPTFLRHRNYAPLAIAQK